MRSLLLLAGLGAVLCSAGCSPVSSPTGDAGTGAGGDAGQPADAGGTGLPDGGVTRATCGNGRLDTHEACDGQHIDESIGTCDSNWLGNGNTRCKPDCTLDVSGCDETDYCKGNGFYGDIDQSCDACERVGGHADPDCAAHCGADGRCASWFDSAVQGWSCELAGFGHDPDCGRCGNGIVEGHEFCDLTAYKVLPLDDGGVPLNSCQVWGYGDGGTVSCNLDCTIDFSRCNAP